MSGEVVLAGPSLTGKIRYRQSGITLTPADAQAQIDKLVDGKVKGLRGSLDSVLGGSIDSLGLGKLDESQDRLKSRAGAPFGLPKLFR